jgi:predicted HTH transcriptional regulator
MFSPIESPSQLPQPGVANERATVDFKVKLEAAERFEPAKDVAAFANGEGGTLLVGAAGSDESVAKYLPMSQAEASTTQRAYEEGVRDRCHPRPIFTVDHLDYGTGEVVAINVWPSVGQPVGVELKQDDLVNKLQGVFFYPVRVGAHKVWGFKSLVVH